MTQKFTFAQREEGFDNHISQSIRGYNDLIGDVINLSQYFVENDTIVYDIGCSTGKMLKAMIEQNKTIAQKAQYIGIEIEEDFYPHFQESENNSIPSNLGFFCGDVREVEFSAKTSLVTSIFTLQFMPRQDRQNVINQIYDSLIPGGAFIFAEKTLSNHSLIQEMRTFTYYDFKRRSFEYDDIMTKEKKLRSMLKANTRDELINMCIEAGFNKNSIDTFWQNYAFIGFIAIKD
jgi:tRNA (cmo5U34)-methyltransferase